MKKTFTYLLGGVLCALFLMPSSAEAASFENFSIIINNQSGTILTSEEMATQGNAVNFGVAVSGGVVSRVDVSDESSIATISGNYHSDHGVTNFQCIVAVPGPVKISLGNCTFGGHEASYQPEGGDKVVFSTTASCWKNNHSDVTNVYYTGGAKTLTIEGADYTPFFAIEEINTSKVNIVYSLGGVTCEGILPSDGVYETSPGYTIPQNFTLYKEGYTLTGWTDGVNTYLPGDVITSGGLYLLTPVFTANAATLADRASATVITWDFRRDNGAPIVEWQGSGHDGHIWVTQVTIGGKTIDVKMNLDASSGKFNNAGNTDWAQVNSGTTFTIPAVAGMTVTFVTYNAMTTTTIAGSSTYDAPSSGSEGNYSTSYTYSGSDETINIVIGDGSYYRSISVVYPAPSTVAIAPAKEYTTFCSTSALNFTAVTGLEAYAVTGSTTSAITLTQVKKVPASTGLILRKTGSSASYDVPVGDAASLGVTNKLVGVTVDTNFTAGDYILSNGTFVRGTAGTLAAGKAYLPAANIDTSANILTFIFEDGETTGISAVERMNTTNDNVFYNLSGQRVAQPTKGLYIVNGKKVIIK